MAEYEKKVRKILSQNGCVFKRRSKGDRDIWYSPITDRLVVETVNDIPMFSFSIE